MTPYEARHQAQRAATDADQVEFEAILRGSVVIEDGVRDDAISGALDDMLVADRTDDGPLRLDGWASADLRLDTSVGETEAELERRVRLLGNCYPFELSDRQLVYRASLTGMYEFCLAITRAQTITRKPYTQLPRAFERVVAKLVESYMGGDSESLHVGSPRDKAIGTSFKKAMSHLERVPYEWLWQPAPTKPAAGMSMGDEGVDFVVQKRLLDDRAGRLYVLGQCACGNDWDAKWNDLNEARLKKWFRTITLVPFVKALAIPFLLGDEMLADATAQAGLVFDRARLVRIAENCLAEHDAQRLAGITRNLSALVLQAA